MIVNVALHNLQTEYLSSEDIIQNILYCSLHNVYIKCVQAYIFLFVYIRECIQELLGHQKMLFQVVTMIFRTAYTNLGMLVLWHN